ncbi:tyrosine--tRNA ligase [Christensenellaceae bacterium OttesenSCG-928-K19]|nr:tyrosine--tRNA ligase [Christensenellaceae bacterium OttesenSCG-928-K19]
MEGNVFDTLQERGYIKQVTHEGLREMLDKEKVTFYVGYDATADSLHVGHFVMLMVMAHMQRAGHRPIVLIGGGTTMIGDPSGKTDMRRVMTPEVIQHNANCFREQISRFLDFSEGKALMVDNADWLLKLNYIDFMREVGVHFTVNRMLAAEAYKRRMEVGLTFFEFSYMLMQAYDFYVLNKEYGCKLEMGGDDQWSNILAGADLIRKKEKQEVYGMTMTLLLKSDGEKMGKTVGGALWLDANKTSPYEFYQYFRNVADADVKNCLSLLTFLPMEEVNRLSALKDSEINEAKKVLAYEVTKQVHGEAEAKKAQQAAEALFGGGAEAGSIPTTEITKAQLAENDKVIDMMILTGLCKSRGEGRRLIAGGGVSLNGNKVTDEFASIADSDFEDGAVMLKKGKKVFHKVVLKA